MTPAPSKAARLTVDDATPWMAALRELHHHSGSVFRVAVVTERNFDALFALMVAGDPHAVAIYTAMVFGMDQINAQPPLVAIPCLACGRAVAGRPRSLGIVVPDVPEPSIAVALAVCGDCAIEDDAVRAALAPCLRTLWPNLRQLGPVMDVVGHA